jgi:hypothetical protein
VSKHDSHHGTKTTLKRLNDATAGGVLGVLAGKVKTRDQVVSTAAAVLVGLPLIEAEGFFVGIGMGIAIGVMCGLLIRIRKWRLGVPRGSSDY